MAVAVSDRYLHEINMMSIEEKLDLVDLIIKSMKVASSKIRAGVNTRSNNWVDELEGRWVDAKSAEEMIEDIKSSRRKNTDVIL